MVSEALASHCITITSEAVGSASVLLKDGESGVLFRDDDQEDFTRRLRDVLVTPEKYEPMAVKGFEIMRNLWNPEIASDRLVYWVEAMQAGKKTPFETGPCSFIR